MSPLTSIAGPTLLQELASRLDDAGRDQIAKWFLLATPPPLSPHHVALAGTVHSAPLVDLCGAVDRAGSGASTLEASLALKRVAYRVVKLALADRAEPAVSDPASSAPGQEASRPGLVLCERLRAAELPLVAFATSAAARQPAGRLTATVGALSPALGTYARSPCGGHIVVDDDQLGGEQLAHTWAHELAHALDPDFGTDDAEAWAEQLGPMLLEAEPVDLAAAEPLIEATMAAIGRRREPSARDTEIEDLADFCAFIAMFP